MLLLILQSQEQLSFQNRHGFYSQEKTVKQRLLSQLDDFDQDVDIGNTASERQENLVVNEGTNYRRFTVGTSIITRLLMKVW